MPVLQDRDQAWSTAVVMERTVTERKLYALYDSLCSPTSPPQKAVPPPWPLAKPSHPLLPRTSHAVGDTPVSPGFRAVLRRLSWARPLTFLWMAAPPPPWGRASWFFNCRFPTQHCPALLAVSPALVQPLGPAPNAHSASSLISVSLPQRSLLSLPSFTATLLAH